MTTTNKRSTKQTTRTGGRVQATTNAGRVIRRSEIEWVPLDKLEVSPLAQREIRPAWVAELAANLDLEQIGALTINERNGRYYIIDGQHRAEAMRMFGFNNEKLQCFTYHGLTVEEEAEMFLKLNNRLKVSTMDEFNIAVQAGRKDPVEINRIVNEAGLHVASGGEGAVRAVGKLQKVYSRSGSMVLATTLAIIRDAYGTHGFSAEVIDGIGLFVDRYSDQMDQDKLVKALMGSDGTLTALLNKTEILRKQTGALKAQCVAAAATDIYNKVQKGAKIPSWWKSNPQ